MKIFMRSITLLENLADSLWEHLITIFKLHTQIKVRFFAVSILSDICGLPSSNYCIRVLEAGFCDQIQTLVL